MSGARGHWLAGPVTVALIVVHLVGLYDPAPGDSAAVINDKVAHALIFGLPIVAAAAARWRWGVLAAVLTLHAPVSEVVQARLLPGRAGDPWDVVADLVGVCLGAGAAALLLRRGRRTDSIDPSSSRQAR